jgi:hypothetical protein
MIMRIAMEYTIFRMHSCDFPDMVGIYFYFLKSRSNYSASIENIFLWHFPEYVGPV